MPFIYVLSKPVVYFCRLTAHTATPSMNFHPSYWNMGGFRCEEIAQRRSLGSNSQPSGFSEANIRISEFLLWSWFRRIKYSDYLTQRSAHLAQSSSA